jgi:hypothetical protein
MVAPTGKHTTTLYSLALQACCIAVLSAQALSKEGVAPCDANDEAQKWALRGSWG